jgi:hypothetical protein
MFFCNKCGKPPKVGEGFLTHECEKKKMKLVKFETQQDKDAKVLIPEIMEKMNSASKFAFSYYDKEKDDWINYYVNTTPQDLCFIGSSFSRIGLIEHDEEHEDGI